MNPLAKTLAVLLLGALTTGSALTQLFPTNNTTHERPASCHEHGGNLPGPQPASHRCCQIGHQPAILQQASSVDSGRQSARILPRTEIVEPGLAIAAVNAFPHLLIPTGDPPSSTPLRI